MGSLEKEANRPTPSSELDALEVWRSISNSWKMLNRDVQRALSSMGLSLAELRILRALSESGPSPMTTLTRELLVTPGAMTSLIDGLEAHGLVERMRSEDDRRVITIKITSKGEITLKRALILHKRYIVKKFEALSKKEIIHLLELLDKLSKSSG